MGALLKTVGILVHQGMAVTDDRKERKNTCLKMILFFPCAEQADRNHYCGGSNINIHLLAPFTHTAEEELCICIAIFLMLVQIYLGL